MNEPANNENNVNNPNDNNVNVHNIIIINNNNSVIPYRRDPDQLMPAANVNRIMRRILPSHAKVSEDTKELLQECTSEFIGFITAEANQRCLREYRKTISAEDILYALSKLGFDNYVGPLTLFLNRYRRSETTQTMVHGDHSVRRRTYFPSIVQPPLLSHSHPIWPHNSVTAGPSYDNYHNQFVLQGHGLFNQATINQYHYFQSSLSTSSSNGGGGDSVRASEFSSTSSSLPPRLSQEQLRSVNNKRQFK